MHKDKNFKWMLLKLKNYSAMSTKGVGCDLHKNSHKYFKLSKKSFKLSKKSSLREKVIAQKGGERTILLVSSE